MKIKVILDGKTYVSTEDEDQDANAAATAHYTQPDSCLSGLKMELDGNYTGDKKKGAILVLNEEQCKRAVVIYLP